MWSYILAGVLVSGILYSLYKQCFISFFETTEEREERIREADRRWYETSTLQWKEDNYNRAVQKDIEDSIPDHIRYPHCRGLSNTPDGWNITEEEAEEERERYRRARSQEARLEAKIDESRLKRSLPLSRLDQ